MPDPSNEEVFKHFMRRVEAPEGEDLPAGRNF